MSSIKLKHSGGNSVSLNPPTSAPTSSEVAFKLHTSDGSAGQVLTTDGYGNLSWVNPGGISMAETWRLTSNITNNGSENVITANLSKPSTPSGYGKVGTETMTESSGVFTFPSTGIYYITATAKQYSLGSGTEGNGNGIYINTTTDNSSYSRTSYGSQAVPTTYDYASSTCHVIFDVTNVSTHKVRFSHNGTSGSVVAGNANDNQTHFFFMKLIQIRVLFRLILLYLMVILHQ